jgi:hypothetical protein
MLLTEVGFGSDAAKELASMLTTSAWLGRSVLAEQQVVGMLCELVSPGLRIGIGLPGRRHPRPLFRVSVRRSFCCQRAINAPIGRIVRSGDPGRAYCARVRFVRERLARFGGGLRWFGRFQDLCWLACS